MESEKDQPDSAIPRLSPLQAEGGGDSVLGALARRIDAALDSDDEDLLRTELAALEAATQATPPPFEMAALLLNRANILNHLRHNVIKEDVDHAWAWNSADLIEEVRCLRLAAQWAERIPTDGIETDLPCRIFTNLGNVFSHLGRTSEAIHWWNRALGEIPGYGMAIGNRGFGVSEYARLNFDNWTRNVLLKHAFDDLGSALTRQGSHRLEAHAVEPFRQRHEFIGGMADWSTLVLGDCAESEYGRSKDERAYRRWCLHHRLFLNPLNDVLTTAEAADDSLAFPAVRVDAKDVTPEPPPVFAFFSQLKREFASARFTCWEADGLSNKAKPHFADLRLNLVNGFDYRVNRLWVDRMRSAFFAAYSVLDKVGPLINLHWGVGLEPGEAEFRKVWFVKNKKHIQINDKFDGVRNSPLRGLYWLSKDIFLKSKDETPMDPDAADLYELRHEITHRYLSIHMDGLMGRIPLAPGQHARSESELKRQTLKLLSLVRAALIYLALAAHRREALIQPPAEGLGEMSVFLVGDDII